MIRTVVSLALFFVIFGLVCDCQELKRAGFLGVMVAPVPADVRAGGGIPEGAGVVVTALVEGGSAASAGIKVNDIIVAIGDHAVASTQDLLSAASSLISGHHIDIKLIRSRESISVDVEIRPRPYESSPDADTLYRAVKVDDSLRRVIVTKPKGAGKFPAVLYITGVGCFSQDVMDRGTTETMLLYGLTRAGFATMRVEKSGMGDSQGPPCASPTVNLEAEVRGYVEGLKALKTYEFVDPERVFIVGLSIGGVDAPLVAQQVAVKGIVVVNTVGKPFMEYLIDTRRRQWLLEHIGYDEIDRRAALNEKCNHKLLVDAEVPDRVIQDLPECRNYIGFPAPYTFMQQWAAINVADMWKRVDSPVLIVYGLSDFVATVSDHPYLFNVIESFHPGKVTIHPIAGMDHFMTRASTMEESMNRTTGLRAEFVPEALTTIQSWLEKQAAQAKQHQTM